MKNQTNTYPFLTKSYKSFYPFRIGTTSYIYPDLYVPNVRMLGPFLDEIELLLFESGPAASLFSKTVIADLQHLSREFNLTYNIHLPTDITISSPSLERRERDIAKLLKVFERVEHLAPSTCTLHVPFSAKAFAGASVGKWRDIVYSSLAKILKSGVPAARIAIESLDYPFTWVEDVIQELKLAICMDIGHLFIQGHDILAFFTKYADAVAVIHLHGVRSGKDHLPLDRLPASRLKAVLEILKIFKGTVSLEVFNYEYLQTSLDFLETHWRTDLSGE
jgi:sugar phosphate isomerase/epimerase